MYSGKTYACFTTVVSYTHELEEFCKFNTFTEVIWTNFSSEDETCNMHYKHLVIANRHERYPLTGTCLNGNSDGNGNYHC
jgi:hypothetical protein